MARMTQFVGLPPKASEYIKNAKVISRFVGTTGIADEPVYLRMFEVEEESDYYGAKFPQTKVYIEVVQAEPWSSGPVIFTRLIDTFGRVVVEWSEEDIAGFLGSPVQFVSFP